MLQIVCTVYIYLMLYIIWLYYIAWYHYIIPHGVTILFTYVVIVPLPPPRVLSRGGSRY